ncbi:hypothetical protein MPSEU_000444800 [Mayamaea pseudoterrestris]|nr:hypothetical protein MPSEU_000444800 [Mayamaea pseudoterrestris]
MSSGEDELVGDADAMSFVVEILLLGPEAAPVLNRPSESRESISPTECFSFPGFEQESLQLSTSESNEGNEDAHDDTESVSVDEDEDKVETKQCEGCNECPMILQDMMAKLHGTWNKVATRMLGSSPNSTITAPTNGTTVEERMHGALEQQKQLLPVECGTPSCQSDCACEGRNCTRESAALRQSVATTNDEWRLLTFQSVQAKYLSPDSITQMPIFSDNTEPVMMWEKAGRRSRTKFEQHCLAMRYCKS